MINFKKSLMIPLLSCFVDLTYFKPLFYLNHSRARGKAIRHFLAESRLILKKPVPEIVHQSLHYYRLFKRLNMFLLLAGMYIKDIEIFFKKLGDAKISGLEILDKNKTKSLIGLSYHIGPFSMIPVILALKGYNSSVLLRSDTLQAQARMSLEKVNEGMAFLARKYNVGRVRFIDSLATMSLVMVRKCMKDGEILMIHPDTAKESSASSIPVNFFNTKIAGHIGVAKLCRFTRANVIPFAIRWDKTDNIKLQIDEPLTINLDGSDDEIVGTFYSLFEKRVAADLEQWIQVESYEKLKY